MATQEEVKEKTLELMSHPDLIRNIGIVAHVDHGKTTLTDNLLAGAGIISDELAGDQTWTDYDEIEQQRGITIKSANVSMIQDFNGKNYLINLIDTPGHVDFGGEVTRALRAVDGAVVLCDAVEGVMPQTEAVLRQALKDRAKPVLFINKVDRYVRELKLTPEIMQKQFVKIIQNVNEIIYKYAPDEYKSKWRVSIEEGSVSFGSAYQKWAINVPMMKESGVGFAQIIKAVEEEKQKDLHKLIPLTTTLLQMVIKHLPDPVSAQAYRIKKIWHGDLESVVGKALLTCDPNGPTVGVVTKVISDPHAGTVAAVRLYSGTIHAGQIVELIGEKQKEVVQQVGIYKGPFRLLVNAIPCGNLVAIVGMKTARAGETIASEIIEPFEEIKHAFEPVVTKAIEPKNPQDLPKLIEALKSIAREDTTLKVTIDQETGEYLWAGLGELHLDVWQTRLERDWKVQVNVSQPIVVYRETVSAAGPEREGKSPNKHNKFYIIVEPLSEKLFKAYGDGDIYDTRVKSKDLPLVNKLIELGMEKDIAKKVIEIYKGNFFIDVTRGQVHLPEVIDTVLEGWRNVVDQGPLAKEKCQGLVIKLIDCTLHEDGIHRGPAQIIPAVRDAIRDSMYEAQPRLLEPIQKVRVDIPHEAMGSASGLVQSRRGKILEILDEGGNAVIMADVPVSGMFGFTTDLRSATQGRGFWSLVDSRFEMLPKGLTETTVNEIRKRKGLKTEEVAKKE
ncbi:MAG: elongation factor EF-2 [archaeon]